MLTSLGYLTSGWDNNQRKSVFQSTTVPCMHMSLLTCMVPVNAGVQVTLGLLWSQPSLSSLSRSHAKIVGSFLYCSPLTVLFLVTIALMWSLKRLITAGLLKKSAVPVTLLLVAFAQLMYCTAPGVLVQTHDRDAFWRVRAVHCSSVFTACTLVTWGSHDRGYRRQYESPAVRIL